MYLYRVIRALRPVNLLMTAGILYSVRYGLFRAAEAGSGVSCYWVYVFSVVCVMAYGYLLNDRYDVHTDAVNKPGKNLFEGAPAGRIFGLAVPLAALSLLPLLYLTASGMREFAVPILLNGAALFLLSVYARYGKGTVLWGNLLVAFLAALLFVSAFFANGPSLSRDAHALRMTGLYALFSFSVTLVREIVKDAEDQTGDARSGIRTLATQYGTGVSKYAAGALSLPLVLLLLSVSVWFYRQGAAAGAAAFFILAVSGIFTLFKLFRSHDKAGFGRTSSALKIYMLLGIISMWI